MADNHDTSSKKIIRKKPKIADELDGPKATGGAGAKVDDDISIISESLDSLRISDSESTIETKSDTDAPKIKNKGTGAGGANTNLYGKSFEEKTSNKTRLIKSGFEEFKIPGHKGKNDISTRP